MHKSDSTVQAQAEQRILLGLNKTLQLSLAPASLDLGGGTSVQIDGLDEANRVACEIYAHVGRLKGSQPDKVAADILKLSLFATRKGGIWRKILCFADKDAAGKLRGRSWLAAAASDFGIEIMIAQLAPEELQQIASAQKKQKMVNE